MQVFLWPVDPQFVAVVTSYRIHSDSIVTRVESVGPHIEHERTTRGSCTPPISSVHGLYANAPRPCLRTTRSLSRQSSSRWSECVSSEDSFVAFLGLLLVRCPRRRSSLPHNISTPILPTLPWEKQTLVSHWRALMESFRRDHT
jgi:hypothetical protein